MDDTNFRKAKSRKIDMKYVERDYAKARERHKCKPPCGDCWAAAWGLWRSREAAAELDALYDMVDRALIAKKFDAVNSFIEDLYIYHERTAWLTGLLTITLTCKRQLPARAKLYDDIEALVKHRHPDRCDKIMQGLH
jgi:hypothetical protein